MKLRSLLVLTLGAIAVSACGGKEARPEKKEGSALGETRRSTSETPVAVQRQVTRTITSQSEIPTVRTTTVRADINRMEQKHFVAIGFPQDVAKNIVEYRDDKGGFQSVNDLKKVEGVSDGLFNRMQGRLGASGKQ